MILLDTCVISETLKPEPDQGVLSWIESVQERQVFLPALVLGELHKGVSLLVPGKKRDALSLWLEQLEERFSERILDCDLHVSRLWGRLSADHQQRGIKMPAVDMLLAATALHHGALFATRNVSHFKPAGVSVINPWEYKRPNPQQGS